MTQSKGKKTMTEKAIAANRANAQKSTGPHDTGETRFNAQWHGRRGSQVVLKNENPEEYQALANTFYEGLEPVGTLEHQLVKIIADRTWEWERIMRMKSQALEESVYRDEMFKDLRILEEHLSAVERSLIRNSRELRAMQAARRKNHPTPGGENGHGHGAHPMPTFASETWEGPQADYLPSQGEVAVYNLTQKAKRAIQNGRAPGYDTPVGRHLLKQADIELSLEGCDEWDNAPNPSDGFNTNNRDDMDTGGYRNRSAL